MENEFFRELMDNLYDGVYLVDCDRVITFWNKAAERITGYKSFEVIGKGCFDNILVHVDEKGHQLCNNGCPLKASIKDGMGREVNAFLRHKDGYRLPVLIKVNAIKTAGGVVMGGVESFNDNSSWLSIHERAAGLEQLALIDALTGAGNRRYANMSLTNKLSEYKRYGWPFGVLFIDIDNFKQFNDKYGHLVGDEVLKMVSQTMVSNMRSFDSVFRWGGEEFLIIISNVDSRRLRQFAERLRIMVQKTAHKIGTHEVSVTVSIGGTLALALDTENNILSRIDSFMYRCKASGKNQCVIDGVSYAPS